MAKLDPTAFTLDQYNGPTQGIIALAGDIGTGKTMFTVLWPWTPTLIIDTEFSAVPYSQNPHAKRNGYGTRWFRSEVTTYSTTDTCIGLEKTLADIPAGKYRTISVDTVDRLWDWAIIVSSRKLGGPTGEVPGAKMPMMWGQAKKLMMAWILGLKAKCDWLFLTSHLRMKYVNGAPSNQKITKAGEVIQELSYLMLTLERNKQSFQPPSAIIPPEGKTRWPAVPPRIPVFTPSTLLYYLQAEVGDYDITSELLPPPVEDPMAALERQVELAERLKKASMETEELPTEE